MKTTRLKSLLAAIIMGSALQAGQTIAQQHQAVSQAADPSVIAAIKTAYPNTAFDQINATPIEGIYEVVMGKNIAYTDRTGQYFLFGNLFDMRTQTDLTQPKRLSLNKIEFNKLPLGDAIKTVKGKGERQLVVFADPNCGYCKRFEAELEKVDNITVYTYLMPILSQDSITKAKAIWCAKDQSAAWRSLMIDNVVPVSGDCENPVERNVTLGRGYGVNGTPTLVAADGRMLPGYVAADRLEAWLGGTQ